MAEASGWNASRIATAPKHTAATTMPALRAVCAGQRRCATGVRSSHQAGRPASTSNASNSTGLASASASRQSVCSTLVAIPASITTP